MRRDGETHGAHISAPTMCRQFEARKVPSSEAACRGRETRLPPVGERRVLPASNGELIVARRGHQALRVRPNFLFQLVDVVAPLSLR